MSASLRCPHPLSCLPAECSGASRCPTSADLRDSAPSSPLNRGSALGCYRAPARRPNRRDVIHPPGNAPETDPPLNRARLPSPVGVPREMDEVTTSNFGATGAGRWAATDVEVEPAFRESCVRSRLWNTDSATDSPESDCCDRGLPAATQKTFLNVAMDVKTYALCDVAETPSPLAQPLIDLESPSRPSSAPHCTHSGRLEHATPVERAHFVTLQLPSIGIATMSSKVLPAPKDGPSWSELHPLTMPAPLR